MTTILNQLAEEDWFNIICFDDQMEEWKTNGSVQATAKNIEAAKQYVNGIKARSATDIDGALQKGIAWLRAKNEKDYLAELIVLLTDGQDNRGGVQAAEIPDKTCKSIGKRKFKVRKTNCLFV